MNKLQLSLFAKLLLFSGSLAFILVINIFFNALTYNALNESLEVSQLSSTFQEVYYLKAEFIRLKLPLQIDLIENKSKKLDNIIYNLSNKNQNQELEKLKKNYYKNINEYINTMKVRGLDENLGIEGAFRRDAHNLENEISNLNDDKALVYLLQIRRSEKDYIMRKNRNYVERVENYYTLLEKRLTELNGKKSELLANYANKYINTFREFVTTFDSRDSLERNMIVLENETNELLVLLQEKSTQKADKILLLQIIIAFVSIILSFSIAYYLSKNISRSIIELNEVTKLVQKGDLTQRSKISSNDEIGDLALSFNKMIEKLELQQFNLDELNKTLEEKVELRTIELKEEIDKRAIAEHKLEVSLEELSTAKDEIGISLEKEKELNALKSRFVAMVSHEYRTPLTVILSSTYLLSKFFEIGNKAKFDESLSKIQKSVDNMKQLLEDTLELGKLENNNVKVNKERFKFVEMMEKIIEENQTLSPKVMNLELTTQNKEYLIESDPLILKHIFNNLVSNAIKYSPTNSTVKVEMIELDENIRVSIIDQGIGIPEEERKFLFDPFFRASNVGSISGTGLGLCIVKRYVDALKGKIWVESKVNNGTKFTIELPKNYLN